MMLKTKPTEHKIKPTGNGYASLTNAILAIKQEPRKLKTTEIMEKAANHSYIF